MGKGNAGVVKAERGKRKGTGKSPCYEFREFGSHRFGARCRYAHLPYVDGLSDTSVEADVDYFPIAEIRPDWTATQRQDYLEFMRLCRETT